MLETPIAGRYLKEERFLLFEPPAIYLGFVYATIIVGVLLISFVNPILGTAVFLAGIWANLSVMRIRFDCKSRMYRRRQGPGFLPKTWHGSFDELDALVVLAEPSLVSSGVVRYHVVLHWKQQRAPLMVLESIPISTSGNMQFDGRGVVARTMKFGRSLNIAVYDNTHFASPCPISVF